MYICVVDREGKILVHCNIKENDLEYFWKKVEPWKHSLTVVCECIFNWYFLADACRAKGIAFVLAHAPLTWRNSSPLPLETGCHGVASQRGYLSSL